MQMQKLLTFLGKTISVYAIFNDQSFSDTLINDSFSFEQLGPELYSYNSKKHATIKQILIFFFNTEEILDIHFTLFTTW